MDIYKYQWSKRYDMAHTISLHGVDTDDKAYASTRCWLEKLRAGCPWRIIQGERIVKQGVGPVPWWA